MAIKADIELKGLSISGAYIRLAHMSGGRENGKWVGQFQVYASEEVCYPGGRKDKSELPSGDALVSFHVIDDYSDADPRTVLFAKVRDDMSERYSANKLQDA